MNCETSKLAPGTWCNSNFSLYSTYLMPRNARPNNVVSTRKITRRLFFLTSAAQAANAMKNPDVMRIAVFAAPNGMLSWFDAATKAGLYQFRYSRYAKNNPPKNMISVSRKSHIPNVPASRCCSGVSKWWRCCGSETCSCSAATAVSCVCGCVATVALSNGRHLVCGLVFEPLVVISLVVHDRDLDKVFGQRRRLNLPLEARRLPRIIPGNRAILQRPRQVQQRKHIPYAKHSRSRSRKHIQHLELRRICVIPPGHSQIPQNELRQERQVESEKSCHSGKLRQRLRIHPARHLRPPEMNTRQKRHQHPTHHHKVEVSDDEIRLRQMNVHPKRTQEDARHATDREQAQKPERVEHRRLKGDRTLLQRKRPVEDLDSRRHRDQHR